MDHNPNTSQLEENREINEKGASSNMETPQKT
jgi:hypothetical protein